MAPDATHQYYAHHLLGACTSHPRAPRRSLGMKKIAVITGANRGSALRRPGGSAAAGVKVMVGARDLAQARRRPAGCAEKASTREALQIDVDSPDSVQRPPASRATARTARHPGQQRRDPARGHGARRRAPAGPRMFRETFETNVFGAISVTKEFLPLLRESASGRIVNVSSTMGSLTDPSDPSSPYYGLVAPAYQTSKAALNGFTIALSKALADTSIKVNSVCPGWVQTDLGGPRTARRHRRPRMRRRRSWWTWPRSQTTARRPVRGPRRHRRLVTRTPSPRGSRSSAEAAPFGGHQLGSRKVLVSSEIALVGGDQGDRSSRGSARPISAKRRSVQSISSPMTLAATRSRPSAAFVELPSRECRWGSRSCGEVALVRPSPGRGL